MYKPEQKNAQSTTIFLHELLDRGLSLERDLLVIIDGAKGLRAAVGESFGKRALVQRCQWHKRENIVSYLPKYLQAHWRKRLQKAYEKPVYNEAKKELEQLRNELKHLNESAVSSMGDGFEETLTLHKLSIFPLLGRSFKTTNCLESFNSQVEARCGKAKHWKNLNQKRRWLASALIDIEPRLWKIQGYRHLQKLRNALIKHLKLTKVVNKAA